MIGNPRYLSWSVSPSSHAPGGSQIIPSQAITKNSSSDETSCITTSGNAVTICCSGERSALFLNSKSPIALDRARLPFTRPKSTNPPAAVMRAFSPIHLACQLGLVAKFGLWSCIGLLTFVLWFMIKRKRLCPTLDSKDGA
jgi:hypothetical protein